MKLLLFMILSLLSTISLAGKVPTVGYPFDPARAILCDQGAKSPTGNSHNYNNTRYAIDLATPKHAQAAALFASADGKVIAYDKCVKHNTKCGAGFGNQIKLLRADGILIFYSHLNKVAVKTGDIVKTGQYLGTEGSTGWTGKGNRHLHFSVHADWREHGYEYYKKHVGALPDSRPFKMNICQTQHGTCNEKPLDIRKLKCKRVTGKNEWVKSWK